MARRLPSAQAAVRRLFEFSARTSDVRYWGKGTNRGSFNPRYRSLSQWSLFTVYSDGTLTVNFKNVKADNPGCDLRSRHKGALEAAGFGPMPDGYENKYVEVPASDWSARVEPFETVVSDLCDQGTNAADSEAN